MAQCKSAGRCKHVSRTEQAVSMYHAQSKLQWPDTCTDTYTQSKDGPIHAQIHTRRARMARVWQSMQPVCHRWPVCRRGFAGCYKTPLQQGNSGYSRGSCGACMSNNEMAASLSLSLPQPIAQQVSTGEHRCGFVLANQQFIWNPRHFLSRKDPSWHSDAVSTSTSVTNRDHDRDHDSTHDRGRYSRHRSGACLS